ncbi:CBS domain-containing protein [Marinicella rhabdoformis]|uniref:CBS domain-containing protein n=1 Tax=Marinicella rhabdoformis TaxID=2580566 RepID=UPI0015D0BA1A|nr:CBS domain-containing protein [Marinicella rhabdoformis]
MKQLKLLTVTDINEVANPEHDTSISTDSSALLIFTDFHVYHPFDLSHIAGAREALNLMQAAHVRMKFVVDDAGMFLGVVSTDDLNEQEINKRQAFGQAASDMTVVDFMRPKSKLKAIEYSDLCEATIAEVMELLKSQGLQHCLVVDHALNQIRGVISSSDIARKLRLPVDISEASDFKRIFQASKQPRIKL